MLKYILNGDVMSSIKKIYFGGIVLLVLVVLSLISFISPKVMISLNGDQTINLSVGEKYLEEGATAKLIGGVSTKKIKVLISGSVNSEIIGQYIVTYKAKIENYESSITRVVNVVDEVKPEIKLSDRVTMCKNKNLLNYEVSASDNYDGDLSKNIKYNIENDNIIFSVKDSSNNEATITKKIEMIDNEVPNIKLNGSKNMQVILGSEFVEPGFSASDSCDGDLTNKVSVEGYVDTLVAGVYTLKYVVSDTVGNKKEVSRVVTVKETINNLDPLVTDGKIYLTFDDGPGAYTEELLTILRNYNVKATFFVTSQFSKYEYLIAKEHQEGHAVGIHTYSHKWSIYESEESYLQDFHKIENIIYNQTGIMPKIFRFPGGSSNTISRRYSPGIMSRLAKLMQDKGYVYFDWTFDSGDTSKKNNSVNDIINNVNRNLKGNGEYIVLMHDIKKNTILAMPTIIETALSKGYTFHSLNEFVTPVHLQIAN